MLKRALIVLPAVTLLIGCEAASDIAGDAMKNEIRNVIATQCEQVSADAGIVADRIAQVCACSADTLMNDPDLTMEDISRERIEGIVNTCTAQTGSGTAAETPAQETNGG